VGLQGRAAGDTPAPRFGGFALAVKKALTRAFFLPSLRRGFCRRLLMQTLLRQKPGAVPAWCPP